MFRSTDLRVSHDAVSFVICTYSCSADLWFVPSYNVYDHYLRVKLVGLRTEKLYVTRMILECHKI